MDLFTYSFNMELLFEDIVLKNIRSNFILQKGAVRCIEGLKETDCCQESFVS